MPAALLGKKRTVHGRHLSSYPILIFGEEPPTPTTLPPASEPSKLFWQPRDISGRPGRDKKKKRYAAHDFFFSESICERP